MRRSSAGCRPPQRHAPDHRRRALHCHHSQPTESSTLLARGGSKLDGFAWLVELKKLPGAAMPLVNNTTLILISRTPEGEATCARLLKSCTASFLQQLTAMVSPSRTSVSTPSWVYASRSSEGRH